MEQSQTELGFSDLHYIDKAEIIADLIAEHSERDLAKVYQTSKSEIHRLSVIAKLDKIIKDTAREKNIQKYVLLDYSELSKRLKELMFGRLASGEVKTRKQFKNNLKRFL